MGGSSKKQTVGYKYHLGMHMILCHGPIDKLTRIAVDEREAWSGSNRGGRINIAADGLFGGESREGGVSGALDFETGHAAQGVNDYLQSRIGARTFKLLGITITIPGNEAFIPSFRGVAGVVLRRMYLGMNPYLKPWAFRAQRIFTRQGGLTQWQPLLAPISSRVPKRGISLYFALDCSISMTGVRLATMKAAMSDVFDIIKPYLVTGGIGLDIKVVAWSDAATGITRVNCTQQDIEDLRAWVNALQVIGGTDFSIGVSPALTFFSKTEPRINRLFFVTDGFPNEGTAASAQAIAADMLDTGSGDYSRQKGTAVHMYGVNIDLTDTSATALLDNTPDDGVPVVSGTNSSGLTNAVLDGLMQADGEADMNPAHIIRECLTDPDWGMGYPESDVDDAAFLVAAKALFDEGLGISLLWDRQIPLEDFVKEIIKHIDGALYVDRASGKFVLRLIRGGYDAAGLLLLGEADIEKVESYARPAFGELVNSVTVNYWDSASGKTASVTAQDTAMVQLQGGVIGTTVQYPGFTCAEVATRIAQRDLRALSTPLLRCTITANRRAAGLNIGDVFRFAWPDYHDGEIIMRVTGLAFGDGRNNRVKITCVQDVFALPALAIVQPEEPAWEDPQQVPVPVIHQQAFEVPYLELVQQHGQAMVDSLLTENPEIGYVGAAAARPQAGALSARLWTSAGAAATDVATVDYCPSAQLAEDIDRMQTVLSITGGADLSEVEIGSWAQLGSELVSVEAIGTGTVTVKRAVLDTVPGVHAAGTALLFWDAYAVGDPTEYVSGDAVTCRLTTVTGSGQLALADASPMTVNVTGRAARPYPPAKVRINATYYPVDQQSDLDVIWVHRNRRQQTAPGLLGFLDDGVTPEAGTTYRLDLLDDIGQVLYSASGITGTSHTVPPASIPVGRDWVDLKLTAVRDGLDSYVSHVIRVNLYRATGDNLQFEMGDTATPPAGDAIHFQI